MFMKESFKKDKKTLELYLTLKNKFFGFFQNLINNFTPYFLFSKDFDHKNLCASDIFDQENYLKIYEEEEFIFMKEFCSKTMVILYFLLY